MFQAVLLSLVEREGPGTTNSFFSNKRRLYFKFEICIVSGHTTADVYVSIR